MRCARCGSEVPDSARFCTRCGATVAAPRAETEPRATLDPRTAPARGPEGERPERPRRRGRVAAAVVASVAIVAALGVAAWLLLPAILGPEPALRLADVPDEAFRSYLEQNVDADGDGAISQEEADAVTTLGDASADPVTGNGLACLGITSLEGISAFTNLTQLVCAGNQLTELDLSGLPDLTVLDCSSNQLTSLDLSANGALTSLACDGNAGLVTLTLPKGDALRVVHASGCGLTSVDLTGLPGLTDVLLDDGAQVTADAATVDDRARDNLELLAALYNFGVEPAPWQQTISTVRAEPGDATVDGRLVGIALTLDSSFALTHGETGATVGGDPLGVATDSTPDVSYTLTDDGVRTILSTYYGSAPDDLSYLYDSTDSLARDAASGTWSVPVGVAPVGETVWAENFTSYGTYLAFDLAMLTLPGTDAPTVHYYHVVAQQSDASALGYRMVSLSAAGDLSASFPDAVAAYDDATSTQLPVANFVGSWYETRNGMLTLHVYEDGTGAVERASGEQSSCTWERADATSIRVHGPLEMTLTYSSDTGHLTDDQGRDWAPCAQ